MVSQLGVCVCVHKARCKGMVIESVERMAWDPWGFGEMNGSDDYLQTGFFFEYKKYGC